MADSSFHMFSRHFTPPTYGRVAFPNFPTGWLIHDQYESWLAPIQQALLVDDHINIYI